jgi:hypothetical protein
MLRRQRRTRCRYDDMRKIDELIFSIASGMAMLNRGRAKQHCVGDGDLDSSKETLAELLKHMILH